MNKCIIVFGLIAAVLHGRAATAEITVLAAGGVDAGLRAAAGAFEKQTGQTVTISGSTGPQVRARITRGEMFDVVIAGTDVLDELAQAGKVAKEQVPIGGVGVGIGVRAGAPLPDITTVDALKRAILAADSLAFTRGTSGVYVENLLKKMEIYNQVESKITRHSGREELFEHVKNSKGNDLSFGQITEIQFHADKGWRLVGPLPADVQNTTWYAATAMAGRPQADAVAAFLRHLGTPASKATFAAAGIQQQ